ncbi:(E)-4-hydroxy-3-methylbut-2-enyl-diphosphate synthase [Bacteroidales bacterium OttesenSCG-928-J19]|nr:(E)-4-hydroxy-3-methylbut-2-enyl-diphosphate synthase [Bacteroidales bacterium OttesenSCG-928-J19]
MSTPPYRRRKSSVVFIGNTPLGGEHPIRIQSMTNTSTLDTEGSIEQCIRIIEAGGEYVRLTAQGVREASNLKLIREGLTRRGYTTPLVADIHFNPAAAFEAAQNIEKVRINPGNFVDRVKTFTTYEYTDEEYQQELEKIRDRFVPLLNLCKEHHTALRIGVNHGSLSDRIMSRYGDTSEGMVESCLEFLRICLQEDFHDVVLSIKASNTVIMVNTVRLLVQEMEKEGMSFPIHLGVTEAGEGEDGRIRSAVGIGALLREGIGDTIRVSLSEDPEDEIPVARVIVDHLQQQPRLSIEQYDSLPQDAVPVRDDLQNPRIIHAVYDETDIDAFRIKAAMDCGAALIDRQADGIWLENTNPSIPKAEILSCAYGILQATGRRISKTEYISCPGCGRTLFDLQTAVKRVKAATSHLTGLKIAVMGCIVNGPGEMADADYGYVGAGAGRVSLYRGKECILKNIPEEEALDKLLQLIEG